MTLDEATALLSSHDIPFHEMDFQNEAEYWQHVTMYPCSQKADNRKVHLLIIRSVNGRKHLTLQFNDTNGVFRFADMRFGDYSYELFDCPWGALTDRLIEEIQKVMSGRIVIISANDLKRKRWLSDACFDYEDTDQYLGLIGFQKAINKIEKKKNIFATLFGSKIQYEIFDWNTYRMVVK